MRDKLVFLCNNCLKKVVPYFPSNFTIFNFDSIYSSWMSKINQEIVKESINKLQVAELKLKSEEKEKIKTEKVFTHVCSHCSKNIKLKNLGGVAWCRECVFTDGHLLSDIPNCYGKNVYDEQPELEGEQWWVE